VSVRKKMYVSAIERDIDRNSVWVCKTQREREKEREKCVCVCKTEGVYDIGIVCVCECVCVCVREREREIMRVCVRVFKLNIHPSFPHVVKLSL